MSRRMGWFLLLLAGLAVVFNWRRAEDDRDADDRADRARRAGAL